MNAWWKITVGVCSVWGVLAFLAWGALPHNYQVVLDNPTVRVVRVTYQPHEKIAVHDHPRTPTVYVYLTDSGPVRFSHVESPPFDSTRAPLKAWTFRVSPGRLETHAVENLGDIPTVFLRVELKRVPLKFQENAFRFAKPIKLTQRGTTSEFWSKPFRIERIITGNEKPVEISDPDHPSLLIEMAEQGQVHWMEAHHQILLKPPSHVLRIVFS